MATITAAATTTTHSGPTIVTQNGAKAAETAFAEAVSNRGWEVRRPAGLSDTPDFIIKRGSTSYAVEIKFAPEGRADRLVPLWSQALLQLSSVTTEPLRPLAVVIAPRIAAPSAHKILEFAAKYAPHAGAGVMDLVGFRRFRGPHLGDLNSDPATSRKIPTAPPRRSANLFSDLNQWMLKLLLAMEIPPHLLAGPRSYYINATTLANAARVSVMTAFRFIEQLRGEGYLDDSAGVLKLVRREDLFDRWRFAAVRRTKEAPIRLLVGGEPLEVATRSLREQDACLGMFTAADALGYGFVQGVPAYLYARRLEEALAALGQRWIPAEEGEAPDLIVRQPAAVKSVFRGAVSTKRFRATDILQTWLDVSTHPTRGAEQADLIRKRALYRLFE